MAGKLLTPDGAAKVWQAVTAELKKPGQELQVKMARQAMANDTSTDHIESKAIIAKVRETRVNAISIIFSIAHIYMVHHQALSLLPSSTQALSSDACVP